MAEVRINRELLTDVLDTLVEYHANNPCSCSETTCCVVNQRMRRIEGALERAEFHTSAAPV